jgi:hypothetical protein
MLRAYIMTFRSGRWPTAVCSALLLMLLAAPFVRADSISNPSAGYAVSNWGPYGNSFGQTFTAPTGGAVLNDFSLTAGINYGSPFEFVAQIYQWNGSATAGPAIYTSAPQTLPSTLNDLQTYTFDPNVAVTPGTQYVALLTAEEQGNVGYGSAEVGTANAGFVSVYNGSWAIYPGVSLAFNADFSPAAAAPLPSPAYAGLGLLGALGAVVLVRRRKAADSAP